MADSKVTAKQKEYAQNIAKRLNISLPEEDTKAAYQAFIKENQERFKQAGPQAMHYTQEQIDRANRVNIVDYARSCGLELKRDGKDYRVKNYAGGFIITPEKNNWNWFAGNQGGGVVNLCMFLENKTWQEAIGTLINEDMEPIRLAKDWKPEPEQPKEFHLPEKNDTDKHVYAYLTKTRGIDADIVKNMLGKGYIYENKQRSCVFVGRDKEGVPRHASVRSTNTTGKAYKKDVSGSQKKHSFSIKGTSGRLNVFEAPIDLLSFMSLQKMKGEQVNDSYVALGGVSDKALEQFLADNKDIQAIRICTDGDEAGEKAADEIRKKYGEQHEIIRQLPEHKDFNEDLVAVRKEMEFRQEVHAILSGKKKISDSIRISETPNILIACGAEKGLDFSISKSVIDKCLRPENRNEKGRFVGKTGHGLSEKQVCDSLLAVKNPVMVLKGNRDNSLVVVTELLDGKSRPIFVTVELDKKSGRTEINNVTSIYGRDKFQEYLERQIDADNIIAIDNKKAESLLQPIGKWYPKRDRVISYDASVAYTLENVKYPENINQDDDIQQERMQVAIESTADYVDPEVGFISGATQNMPAGTKYRIVTYGEDGRLVPYQDTSVIYSDRTKVQDYIKEHRDELEVINYDEMVYQAGRKNVEYIMEQKRLIEEGLHSFQFDEKGYLHFSIDINNHSYDGMYRIYDPENGRNRELVSIDDGQNEPFFKENWEEISQYLKQYVNDHPVIEEDGTAISRETASIYCDWSENIAFEKGKTYSVSEFDERMKQADTEWCKLRQQEREQYGEDAFEELLKLNLPQHQTYEKVKYTVYVPGLEELTLRQDIGDGFGGVIDYIKTTTYKHYVEPLKYAVLKELSQELDDVAQVLENRTRIEEQTMQLQSEMRYEEADALLNTLPDIVEQQSFAQQVEGLQPAEQKSDKELLDHNAMEKENLIKLQGVPGHHKGTPAKELKIGDVLVWNGGETSEVVGMVPSKTGKTIVFQMKSAQDGEVRDRRMKAETLVVVQDKRPVASVEKPLEEFGDNNELRSFVMLYERETQSRLTGRTIVQKDYYLVEGLQPGMMQFFYEYFMREPEEFETFPDYLSSKTNCTCTVMKGFNGNSSFFRVGQRKSIETVMNLGGFKYFEDSVEREVRSVYRVLDKYAYFDSDKDEEARREEIRENLTHNTPAKYLEVLDAYSHDDEVKYAKNDIDHVINMHEIKMQNEPIVTIHWSESEFFVTGEKLPLSEALERFAEVEQHIVSQKESSEYKGMEHYETEYEISYYQHGEYHSFVDRMNFGDGEKTLESHLILSGRKDLVELFEQHKQFTDVGKRALLYLEHEELPEAEKKYYYELLKYSREGHRMISVSDLKGLEKLVYPEKVSTQVQDKSPAQPTQEEQKADEEHLNNEADTIDNNVAATENSIELQETLEGIEISDVKATQSNTIDFKVNLGDGDIHAGEAGFDEDGTVNFILVDPVPESAEPQGKERKIPDIDLRKYWDKIVDRVKELLQEMRYKSREFVEALNAATANPQFTTGSQYENMRNAQANPAAEQGTDSSENVREQENADPKTENNIAEDVKSEPVQRDMISEYKEFAKKHKEMVKASADNGKRIPIVINAYGGPGAGKSVSCMDICQQLNKLGYHAELVQEYAKDLVYDGNMEMLDGSAEHQFEILKEQLRRMDRLYGKVDFIVTDSPLLLNGVYNKEITPEYSEMIDSLSGDFHNFTYFVERDTKSFQQEGRIHNMEESQKLDQDIKELLSKKGIYYGTYDHDTIGKVVTNVISTFNRVNNIEEPATERQTAYAKKLAEALGIELPAENTKSAYKAFIEENQDAFSNSGKTLVDKETQKKEYQDYLEMVKKNGSKLKDVPKEHYTEELLLAAVTNWGAAIQMIPEEKITSEIALASVRQYGLNLKHVPEKLKSEEICIAAYINSSGKSIRYTPADLKDNVKEKGKEQLSKDSNLEVMSKRQLETDKLQEQGQEWVSQIENMFKEHEENPEAMVEDIAFATKFYQYSPKNIQLMLKQNPHITYVASKSDFEKMGYHVKNGEQALIGRVPNFDRYILNEKEERVYSKNYTEEQKKAIKAGTCKEYKVARKFPFRAAFYDISQTDCPVEDYPSVYHMGIPSELHQEAFDAMKEFAEKSLGFKVMVTDLKSISLRGSCSPEDKIIRINDKLESTMALSTLCHEIGHAIIHTVENVAKATTAQKECEADVMDIMLEASLGISINESRKEHLFKAFHAYKDEQAAKERAYNVTLEKLIEKVQTKVFRPYVEDINHYLDLHLPVQGVQNETAAKEVIKNIALVDSAYQTSHQSVLNGENPLFDKERMDEYQELYKQTVEEYRLSNSFVPKLAAVKYMNGGYNLCNISLVSDEVVDMIKSWPENFGTNSLNVRAGDLLVLKENVLEAPRVYLVEPYKLEDKTHEMPESFQAMEHKINCDFDAKREYECIHNLLENNIELKPGIIRQYEYICDAFGFEKYRQKSTGMQLMAHINQITEELSPNSRELVAEYVFRTGNFEKAEKYAEQLEKKPGTTKQLLDELKLVDSYKYMLWTIAEYENQNDVSVSERITTGAYNSSSIPVLSDNVHSLSQIDQCFLLIQKHADPESIKYYAVTSNGEGEGYRIAYVDLDDYQPSIAYSSAFFGSQEEAENFYKQYLESPSSRLVSGTQADKLIKLENGANQIALTSAVSIKKTIAAQKHQYQDLGEDAALDVLRNELKGKYPGRGRIENKQLEKDIKVLKDFKKMVSHYGEEHFIELSNLKDCKDAPAVEESLQLAEWLNDQKVMLDSLSVKNIDAVKQCVDNARKNSVTAVDIEKAYNAIDSAVLSSEFTGIEAEFADFEEYNNVLDTLKAAYVTPDKYCYVDYGAKPGPVLYTSDLAGNTYKKSLRSEWSGSIKELYDNLKLSDYQICTSMEDFRALSSNCRFEDRLGLMESGRRDAFVHILDSTSDILPKDKLISIYDFKDSMDKLYSGTPEFDGKITYKLMVRQEQEIHSYIDTYGKNAEKNVYEQLYDKAKQPELSKIISKQYYRDQINFNEQHLMRPLLAELKKEQKPVSESEEMSLLLDSNQKLKEEIKRLDLSPADAELLKLNAGNSMMMNRNMIEQQMQMNQQTAQRIKAPKPAEEIGIS